MNPFDFLEAERMNLIGCKISRCVVCQSFSVIFIAARQAPDAIIGGRDSLLPLHLDDQPLIGWLELLKQGCFAFSNQPLLLVCRDIERVNLLLEIGENR